MSIQRIDIPSKHTHGWQARAHLKPGKRLTAFFSDSNGGRREARRLAKVAETLLKRQAKRAREA